MLFLDEIMAGFASAESALVAERRARSVAGAAASAPGPIPVISLAPFAAPGGSDADRAAVAAEWDAACRRVGFVKVVDHGVPPGVIDRAWSAATDFFRLPLAEKASVAMTEDYPYGYQAMGTENLEASLDKGADAKPGDVKEMFNLCIGSASGGAGLAPVRWPAGYDTGSRAALEEYYSELEALSCRLYRVCALALGLPEGWFDPRIANHRNVIRAIHYPGQQTPPEPGQVRAPRGKLQESSPFAYPRPRALTTHSHAMTLLAHAEPLLRRCAHPPTRTTVRSPSCGSAAPSPGACRPWARVASGWTSA